MVKCVEIQLCREYEGYSLTNVSSVVSNCQQYMGGLHGVNLIKVRSICNTGSCERHVVRSLNDEDDNERPVRNIKTRYTLSHCEI